MTGKRWKRGLHRSLEATSMRSTLGSWRPNRVNDAAASRKDVPRCEEVKLIPRDGRNGQLVVVDDVVVVVVVRAAGAGANGFTRGISSATNGARIAPPGRVIRFASNTVCSP